VKCEGDVAQSFGLNCVTIAGQAGSFKVSDCPSANWLQVFQSESFAGFQPLSNASDGCVNVDSCGVLRNGAAMSVTLNASMTGGTVSTFSSLDTVPYGCNGLKNDTVHFTIGECFTNTILSGGLIILPLSSAAMSPVDAIPATMMMMMIGAFLLNI